MFQSPVDIANRGMQHIGAVRIGALGFGELSVQASECGFVYDKVRRAELRRNVWRFATRLCVLRPFEAHGHARCRLSRIAGGECATERRVGEGEGARRACATAKVSMKLADFWPLGVAVLCLLAWYFWG
jgi:hypothetical protein